MEVGHAVQERGNNLLVAHCAQSYANIFGAWEA